MSVVRLKRWVPVAIAVLLVAAAVVFAVGKASFHVTPTKPSGSSFSSWVPPFAATAPWNVPVKGLAVDVRSDMWRDRFWNYAIANLNPDHPEQDLNRGHHDILFGLETATGGDPTRDFSIAVYNAIDATTTRRVRQRSGWNFPFNIAEGEQIPWNPGWRSSTGSDSILLVVDPRNGRLWSLGGLVQAAPDGSYNDSQCLLRKLSVGYDRATDLCAGGATTLRNPDGTVADYRTFAGNDPVARGVGISDLAMLTFPEEVRTGAIRHALMMGTVNTMIGPPCDASVGVDDPAFGDTCGRALAPAGSFERISDTGNCQGAQAASALLRQRQESVPEGMRFSLDITDTQIDTWLDQRGYTGAKRSTARTFAVALRDYGWFVTDTTCFGADFQVASAANPATLSSWRSLGITGDGRDLLWGLMTRERVRAYEPAVNDCVDGTSSRFECHAVTTHYGDVPK